MTEKDDHLLHYLFVNKVATVGDIHMDIFDNIKLRAVQRRLKQLSRAGLIEPGLLQGKRNYLVYFLARKGFKKYVADDGVAKRVQLVSDSIEHDLTVLEIKRKFKTFQNVAKFYSENLIRSGLLDESYPELEQLKELRPDAVVKVKVGKKYYFLPLEYEASAKYSGRNVKLLSKYYTNPYVAGVLFISKTGTIEKKVRQKELDINVKDKGKFYYARLEDVLKSQGRLAFENVTDDILTIV